MALKEQTISKRGGKDRMSHCRRGVVTSGNRKMLSWLPGKKNVRARGTVLSKKSNNDRSYISGVGRKEYIGGSKRQNQP